MNISKILVFVLKAVFGLFFLFSAFITYVMFAMIDRSGGNIRGFVDLFHYLTAEKYRRPPTQHTLESYIEEDIRKSGLT